MKRLLLILALFCPLLALAQGTATQYVLNYTAGNTNQCTIEVSTSNTYSPLFYAVDETKFTNAGHDGQTNASARQFVIGQKWIGQENVSVPSVGPVGGSAAVFSSSPEPQVTVTVTNTFSVGDNVTVTGMTNSAFNDPWTRIIVASGSSFTYLLPSTTTASGTTGSGTVTRANRYSLALATNTLYYYRVGGAGNTCSASGTGMPTGSFTTMNIPNGNTWEEGPVTDNNGLYIEPTISESRTASFVDPLTGTNIYRLGLFSDGGASSGTWTSGFFRACSLTTSANGFYHCQVPVSNYGSAGYYSIKSTGETHWLGWMHFTYTDSGGHTCCQQGVGSVISSFSSTTDTSNANVSYGNALTNAGVPYSAGHPAKVVLIKVTYPGNDAVDAAPASDFDGDNVANTTALTSDPSNTLTDKFVAFDATYDPERFGACQAVEAYGDYITGYCGSFNQGSPTWLFAYKISTASVAGLGPFYKNPRCRWCGSHGTTVVGSQKWMGTSSSYTTGQTTGEWHANLASGISAGVTSMTVTAPAWQSGATYGPFGYPYDLGWTIIDSNGNLQVCLPCKLTEYVASSGSHPTWNTNLGGTTTDGGVTWTNEGLSNPSPNEPQNIFANPGGDGTTYWSFLMAAAGGTGGGGEYNGDLFKFEDGTNECVRVVTVGSSGQWTSVTRAYNANGIGGCAATASAHSAGASLRAVCEQDSEVQAYAGDYWDFIDDPHMTDTTNTYFVQLAQSIGHGYAREPAPHGGLFNTFQIYNTHNPFQASDFTGNLTLELSSTLTFNNITTDLSGVAHQDYTNWDFESASFKDSALGSNFFTTGAGTGGYGTFAKVAGTTSIYKYQMGNAGNGTYGTFSFTYPYVPNSGGNAIKDISGPSSSLTDAGAVAQSCIVVVAGECWSGSAVGEMYANLPVVDAGSYDQCNPGGENASFLGHDWCMMNTSTFGDALNQYGLLPANFLHYDPNRPSIPVYGAGLSRRLAQNAIGGFRLQSFAPHAVSDGSAALFYSCIADPHLSANGVAVDPRGCQAFAALIPPQPTADGLLRNDYLTLPITIGSVGASPSYAVVEYGYEENEPTRAMTFPPTIHYYCTQYHASCYVNSTGTTPFYTNTDPTVTVPSGAQHLTLSQVHNITMGVPQRVLAYRILYYNSSNAYVGTSGIQYVSTDYAAVGGPAISFSITDFGSVNVGSSSSPQTVTVTNTGTSTLTTGATATVSSNPSEFTVSSDTCSSTTVTAGSTCTFHLTFSPSTGGSRSATITITGTGSNGTVTGSASATGTGVASGPAVTITPSPVAFGNVNVGTPSALSITVTNSGSTDLIMGAGALVNSGTNAGDFAVSNDTCSSQTVHAGNNCTATETFTPGAAGSRVATLTVTSNASTATDSLTGTGVTSGPIITITPNPGNFGSVNVGGTSSPLTITATNSGNANQTFGANAVTCSTGNTTDFCPLITDGCSGQVIAYTAPNNTCTASLTFKPSASGARTTSLVFTGTASGSTTLNGTGVSGGSPSVGLTPTPINFGSVLVGNPSSTTLTVTNTGTGPLILTTSGVIASDSFNRASLGANWTANTGTFDILSSTSVEVNAPGGDNYISMYWNANTPPADHYSQITITAVGATCSGSLGPAVRMSSSAETYYMVWPCAGSLYIQKKVAGAVTTLGSATYSATPGDVIRLSATGTTLTATVNGSTLSGLGPVTDSSIASGYAGIMGNTPSGTKWEVTPWSMGSGSAPAVTITTGNASDFNFSNDACSGNTIAAGNHCTVTVTFTPSASGARQSLLTVTDTTDSVSGGVVLSGTGALSSTGGSATGGKSKSGGKAVNP